MILKNIYNPFLLAIFLSLLISGCKASEGSHLKQTAALNVEMLAGKSWDILNERGRKAEWHFIESQVMNNNIALFETQFEDKDGSFHHLHLEVVFEAEDHVKITQRKAQGISECQYIGHIWTETSLEDYDSFTEDPMPENRPVFYRIVKGTYSCGDMKEPETWIAKINESN